ncbi:MAG: hypothetical protein DMG57_38165 [Acidobacteria bacterium]|nr:MAG: hypothetical protein DMG57_38165 [Acidobacteriota bacterium]
MSQIDSMLGATGCILRHAEGTRGSIAFRRSARRCVPPACRIFPGYRVIPESSARAYDYPTELGSEFLRKVRTYARSLVFIKLCAIIRRC